MSTQPSLSSKRKIDILFLSHVGVFSGGAEKSLYELIKDCLDQNLTVHVLLPEEGDFAKKLKKNRVSYSIIPQAWWTLPIKKLERINNARATTECVNIIRKLQPRFCVTNTITVPPLAMAAAITGIPHAWIIREYMLSSHQMQFRLKDSQTYRLVSELSDKVFFNSETVKNYYSDYLTFSKKPGILYPFIQPPKQSKQSTSYFPSISPLIKLVIVGRVLEAKGQLEAVRAVYALKQQGIKAHLNIVGETNTSLGYYQHIKKFINDEKMSEDVTFLDQMEHPFEVVTQADIALTCSPNEAFGRVTVEYMLCGTPVIGGNSGGTAEIIKDNTTGLLYEIGKPLDLAKKIQHLANDKQLMQKLSINAKKEAIKRFDKISSHKDFFDYIKTTPNQIQQESLNLSLFKDLIEYQKDKDIWWEKEKIAMKEELTKSHHIITSLQEEMSKPKFPILHKIYKKIKKK